MPAYYIVLGFLWTLVHNILFKHKAQRSKHRAYTIFFIYCVIRCANKASPHLVGTKQDIRLLWSKGFVSSKEHQNIIAFNHTHLRPLPIPTPFCQTLKASSCSGTVQTISSFPIPCVGSKRQRNNLINSSHQAGYHRTRKTMTTGLLQQIPTNLHKTKIRTWMMLIGSGVRVAGDFIFKGSTVQPLTYLIFLNSVCVF